MSMPMIPLGDAAEFIRNGLAIDNRNGVGGIPITRIETISDHRVDPNRVGYAGVRMGERDGWLLKPGDVLFSHINSVAHLGKCALYQGNPEQLLHGMNLLNIRPKDDVVLPRFLVRALRSDIFRSQLAKHIKPAVNQASVSIAALRTLRIPAPAISEQRRIADILDIADAVRRKRKESIAFSEKLARSVFLEMFGDPVTNPMGWSKRPLARLGRVVTGGTPRTDEHGMFGGGIPFITPGDLESSSPVKRTLTDLGAAQVGTVREGAALVCCIGTVGKMAQARQRSAFNQQINAVEWNDEIEDAFGIAALRFLKSVMLSSAPSTTLPILKKSLFERLEIPVPPRELQRKFASRQGEISRLQTDLAKHSSVLDSLASSLFDRSFHSKSTLTKGTTINQLELFNGDHT